MGGPSFPQVQGRFCQPLRLSRICSTLSTSKAPSRISWWQPLEPGWWIEPGMAYTSRPCSAASRAVISEPLARLASTTSTPSDRPLMIRLRRGKFAACGLASKETPTPAHCHLRSCPGPARDGAVDKVFADPCRARRWCAHRPAMPPDERHHRPQSQPAGDGETGLGKTPGKCLGGVQRRRRCAATADDGQLRPLEQCRVAGHEEQRRGCVRLSKQRGIRRGVPHQQMLARTL